MNGSNRGSLQSRLRSGQAAAHWLIRSNEDRSLLKPPETEQAKRVSRIIRQRLEQSPVLGSISFAVPAKEQTKKIKGSRGQVIRLYQTLEQGAPKHSDGGLG